jgi:hypothetical protein
MVAVQDASASQPSGRLTSRLQITPTSCQPSIAGIAVATGKLGSLQLGPAACLQEGVRPGYAFLATLAYRVVSYWLPLLAGLPAYLLFRHRYGRPVPQRATPAADSQS